MIHDLKVVAIPEIRMILMMRLLLYTSSRKELFMLFRISVAIWIVLGALPLSAAEKPAIHLTGNPKVDFFANTSLLSRQPNVLADTTISLSNDMEPAKEKSPWVAGIMSLVVPGAGEVYSKNY